MFKQSYSAEVHNPFEWNCLPSCYPGIKAKGKATFPSLTTMSVSMSSLMRSSSPTWKSWNLIQKRSSTWICKRAGDLTPSFHTEFVPLPAVTTNTPDMLQRIQHDKYFHQIYLKPENMLSLFSVEFQMNPMEELVFSLSFLSRNKEAWVRFEWIASPHFPWFTMEIHTDTQRS